MPASRLLLLLALLVAAPVHANPYAEDDLLEPPRLAASSIRVDGVLDEPAWTLDRAITRWYQQAPQEGSPPSQRTQMWITYDAEALYVAARVFEADPTKITTRTLERDSYTPDQDAVALILDTFDDDRNAVGFIVTPAGVRTDVAISNDANSFEPWSTDWNTFWDAETRIDSRGWTAEVRIPFSSLRFVPTDDGSVQMGLILWRYIARNVEYDVHPAIPNDWSFSAVKPSRARPVRFDAVRPSNPIYVKPYALGGLERTHTLEASGSAYSPSREIAREAGLDLKYSLTSNLTLDVTVNTDFAQVEADDQQVNLTRFSLFFPEKRDFFQERADLFEYRLPGGPQRLFQSRRIGIVDGHPIPIIGGARLTGRVGEWDVGALQMQTARTTLADTSIGSENFGVLRLRRSVLDQGSYVGGLVTSRTDFDGYYNLVAAADADLYLGRSFRHEAKLAYSTQPDALDRRSLLASFVLRRTIRRGWGGGMSFTHIGADFLPAVGFLTRTGINRYGHRVEYTWFPEHSRLQHHGFTSRLEYVWGAASVDEAVRPGRWLHETTSASVGWSATMQSGLMGEVGVEWTKENLADAFTLGDDEVVIPAGRYRFVNAEAKLETPSGLPIRMEAEATAGGYFGGEQYVATVRPLWNPSPYLSLGVDYSYNHARVPGGTFTAHLTRLRVGTAVNRALTASAYVQVNTGDDALTTNVRIRYNPREGSDLFIVYNEGLNIDRDPLDPRDPVLPFSDARSILVKYTYTFAL